MSFHEIMCQLYKRLPYVYYILHFNINIREKNLLNNFLNIIYKST